MPLTNAEKQSAHRARRAAKLERQRAALMAIIARLDGNEKPLAVELRKLAEDGLA